MSSAGHYMTPDGDTPFGSRIGMEKNKTNLLDEYIRNLLVFHEAEHFEVPNPKCPKCIEQESFLPAFAEEFQENKALAYGPCSACGDGDTELKYHSHDSVIKNMEVPCGYEGCKNVRGNGSKYCGEHRKLSDYKREYPTVETKQTNPKDIVGSDKVPMGLVPPVTTAYLALGHLEGDLKYGRTNWREAGVRTMIYVDAAKRHIDKFRDGEWADPSTKVPHLANALACLSIIIDAYHAGKLNDDRPKAVDSASVIDELSSVVKHLKQLHEDANPLDYLIDGPRQRK